MAEDNGKNIIEKRIESALGESMRADDGAKVEPLYRMISDQKIPVSKATGKLWQGRKTLGCKVMEEKYYRAWDEAMAYYNHDHTGIDGDMVTTKGMFSKGDETENVVFSNVTTLMPLLYSRNPTVEITSTAQGEEEEAEDEFARNLKELINHLFSRKSTPGINLKHKVRRQTLFAALCNIGWLKLSWVHKDMSSEGVVDQINQLAEQLRKAKTASSIRNIEGKLQALEEKFSVVEPGGPKLRLVRPTDIVIDPEAEDISLSDANWMMERDYLPTEYISAMYLKKTGKDKQDALLFHPTHTLKITGDGQDGETNMMDAAFEEYKPGVDYKSAGFSSEEEYRKHSYTCVWWVWDKITRRVYLFHSQDWVWPLWVWDDPLKLSRFFPYFGLQFHEATHGMFGKGEVTYYLDQQDAINEMNAQAAKAREEARIKVFFNSSKVKADTVDEFLNGAKRRAFALELGEDVKIDDVITTLTPVNLRYEQLFDIRPKLQAIDRITGITDVMRGKQLKTNTTQDAVNLLHDATQVRLDEKVDKIEEMIGDIGMSLAELCVQFMSTEDVTQIIGSQAASSWRQMSSREFTSQYWFRVAAGSTEKPTSKVKQTRALEIAQVLGQFVNAAPATILVILQMLTKSFTDFNVGPEDWAVIRKSIEVAMTKGVSTQPNGAAGPQSAGAGGGVPPQAQAPSAPNGSSPVPVGQAPAAPPEFGNTDAIREIISNVIRMLPPDTKAQLEQAVQKGQLPIDALLSMLQGVRQ